MFDKIHEDDCKRSPMIQDFPQIRCIQIGGFIERIMRGEWVNKDGNHILHDLAEANLAEITLFALHKKAPLDVRNRSNHTPLHRAAYWGNLEVAKVLIESGADLEAKGNNGGTPIHLAAEHGYPEMVRFLIRQGAKKDSQQDYSGNTPMHFAALRAHREIVGILLQEGANPKLKNKDDMTPLTLARCHSNSKTAEVLENFGVRE